MKGVAARNDQLVGYLHSLFPFLSDWELSIVVSGSVVEDYNSHSLISRGEGDLRLHLVLEGSIAAVAQGSVPDADAVPVHAGSSLGMRSCLTGRPGKNHAHISEPCWVRGQTPPSMPASTQAHANLVSTGVFPLADALEWAPILPVHGPRLMHLGNSTAWPRPASFLS